MEGGELDVDAVVGKGGGVQNKCLLHFVKKITNLDAVKTVDFGNFGEFQARGADRLGIGVVGVGGGGGSDTAGERSSSFYWNRGRSPKVGGLRYLRNWHLSHRCVDWGLIVKGLCGWRHWRGNVVLKLLIGVDHG